MAYIRLALVGVLAMAAGCADSISVRVQPSGPFAIRNAGLGQFDIVTADTGALMLEPADPLCMERDWVVEQRDMHTWVIKEANCESRGCAQTCMAWRQIDGGPKIPVQVGAEFVFELGQEMNLGCDCQ